MKILALEPYYGGSHRAFLDGWVSNSRHDWTLLTHKASKWKWRMRHSPLTMAHQANELAKENKFDLIFCCDMLNLAEFKGLVNSSLSRLPALIYFHENQLTYPIGPGATFDAHFGFTNFISASAAEAVWFNSEFHRSDYLNALESFLKRMPDNNLLGQFDNLKKRAAVCYPGIADIPEKPKQNNDVPVVVWAARWEYDKNPEEFFKTMFKLKDEGLDFKISVIGQRFTDTPPIFDQAKERLAGNILRFGFQSSRDEYFKALGEADIFVSTANHEFFGISAIEAIAAGAYPLLPNRLAYPEILSRVAGSNAGSFLYDGSEKNLTTRLKELITRTNSGQLWSKDLTDIKTQAKQFQWHQLADKYDRELEQIVANHKQTPAF